MRLSDFRVDIYNRLNDIDARLKQLEEKVQNIPPANE